MAFRIDPVTLSYLSTLRSASFEVYPWSITDEKFEVKIEYYLNPGDTFTSKCIFTNGTSGILPLYTGSAKMHLNKQQGKINIWHQLKEIVKLPVWKLGSYLILVLKPTSTVTLKDSKIIPDNLKLDLSSHKSPLRGSAYYEPKGERKKLFKNS